ncbi:MAG: UDP-2,3-diacylglucosamine diphosphatase [Bacteroidales bacterium]|jgi:UDP-2,3-diacylglucosamine hydrolase|nr:UDP-2,3-diacylglucosamine diphosphatase [Bacteroidales bacterium]
MTGAVNSKTFFVSDVHLGAPALHNNRQRERLFTDWLAMIRHQAGALFLLGDLFDCWFEYRRVIPKGFIRPLAKIAEIADAGIPVHFFTGNHDGWTFDYLEQELGLTVHRHEWRTTIGSKKFLLAHGDGLNPTDKGYLLMKKVFSNRFAQWGFKTLLHPDAGLYLAHKLSKKSRLSKPSEPFKNTDEETYRYALKVLDTEQIDYFVFGHRHLMFDIPVGAHARLINLGDWFNFYSYGVFDGVNLELKQYYTNE